MLNLTGPEDGGIGALIVAVVWLVVEWWKKRSSSQAAK
jgi:hypothetical protein